jgi:EAL and modified HD-GYP domain-containing signal transduction protein
MGESCFDGDRATTSLLTGAFLTEGLETISDNKPCFINFTHDLLVKNIPAVFPKTKIIVEILEDVQPTDEVIAACKNLKELGYTLAMDDFVYEKKLKPLIELADIIKIDFRLTPVDTIHRVLYHLSGYKLKFLAEKVETHSEFGKALKLGFTYFQGFFFATPEKIKIKEITTVKTTLLRMLAEINRPDILPESLAEIIEADVSLSYKLLRYVNSAYFYRLSKVQSIIQAVAYLGENEIRRFITLIIISEIAGDKPMELVRMAAVRAKFCSLLGEKSPDDVSPTELFMLGLFSLLPAMLDYPIKTITDKLPLSENLKKALTLSDGPLAPYLQAVITYEKRKKDQCMQALATIHVQPALVYGMYLEAVSYSKILTSI